MMFWISPLLALVALVSVPISMLVTGAVMKRSQGMFVAAVAAHRHGSTRTSRRPSPATRWSRSSAASARSSGPSPRRTTSCTTASFGAQFVSGLIMPIMMFIGNLNYVVIAVLGGLRVASGSMSLGDVQAFIQYSRQFTQPLTQVASMMNLLQSGVASAERVFELLDAEEQSPEATGPPAAPDERARRGALRGRVVLLRPPTAR